MSNQIVINQEQKLRIDAFKGRLKKREIWINGPINNSLVEILYTNIINLQEQSDKLPIGVVINSDGGTFHEAVVATDLMGTSPCLIRTIALANAISGGFIIFMGGNVRICHDYTNLMIHSAGFGIVDKVPDIEGRLKHVKYFQEKLARFLSQQTGGKTTKGYWMEIFDSGKDKWFSVEEALELGIVHKVNKRKSMIDPMFNVIKPYTWVLK